MISYLLKAVALLPYTLRLHYKPVVGIPRKKLRHNKPRYKHQASKIVSTATRPAGQVT